VITGFEVPLDAAILMSLATLVLGILAGWALANRRRADRMASQAVLRGWIDQMATLQNSPDAEARDAVLGHIAAVMKAGVRRDDSITQIAGDGFTIILPGADERAARSVAERLRRTLAHSKLPQSGASHPFTASFGIAAGRGGEALMARARAALDAARKSGCDHVVAASEIEEVMFLPAPASPSAAAAA
jgi:diguanylate cyclase (GGDEF)-like protein